MTRFFKTLLFIFLISINQLIYADEKKIDCKAFNSIEKIEQIQTHEFKIFCKKGIGTVTLNNAKPQTYTFHLNYEKAKAFKKIEGVQIFDLSKKQNIDIDKLKSNKNLIIQNSKVIIKLPKKGNFKLTFIDFYRN